MIKRVRTTPAQHFRQMRVAYVVLALSLFATGLVYFRVRSTVATRDRARFDRILGEERGRRGATDFPITSMK